MEEQPNFFGPSCNNWTLEEQADLFDISLSGLNKWIGEGFPAKGSLKEKIRWVRENRPLASDNTLTEARRMKIEVETQLRRFDLLIKTGELIQRSEVVNLFTDRVMIMRSGLINFHRVIEAKMMGRDFSELGGIVKAEGKSLLERYSRRSGPLLPKDEKK